MPLFRACLRFGHIGAGKEYEKTVTFFAPSLKKALNKCKHWSGTKNESLLFIQQEPFKNPERRR